MQRIVKLWLFPSIPIVLLQWVSCLRIYAREVACIAVIIRLEMGFTPR